jgi:general secretion pathway protein D
VGELPMMVQFVPRNRLVLLRPAAFVLLFAVLLFAGSLLVGCNNLLPDNAKQSPNVLDQTQSLDLLPRFPQSSGSGTANRSKDARASIYGGAANGADPLPAVTLEGAGPTASGDGYDLNFDSAPVATVAKVVLGDILGAGYIIDPRVQGIVTLTSGRPVPKSDILFVLESALRVSNVALVRETQGYRLVPSSEAVGAGHVDVAASGAQPQPGYGISVVPLRFVSAATLTKLLDNFATKPGSVRVDTSRNILILQGSGPERRSAVETVLSFDTDWMAGQTVGIFPVKHSAPEPLIAELEKIMDSGDGGLSQSLIKMQPIARQNAILVVAGKPALLKTAENWIRRLDNSELSSTGVKVYRVHYGDARYIAQILNEMFGTGGSSGTIDSASNQIAPAGGMSTSSSGLGGPAGGSPLGGSPLGGSSLGGNSLGGGLPGSTPGSNSMSPADRLIGGPQANRSASLENAAANGSPAFGNSHGGAAGNTLLPGVRITADVVNNSLLIYANEEDYRIIEGTLRQIDRPQLQVAFDATIAEVTLNDNLAYGVQFFLKSNNFGAPLDTGSVMNSIGGAVLSRVLPGFNLLIGAEATPQVVINALHSITDVKILSNPSLVVVDNGVATLQVGDQVPITTGTATVLSANNAVVNTINYQNTGIILRVIPRVSFNNNVKMDVEQEISNVSDTNTTGSLTPTISERKVKSTLTVADGQTVLLAGLVSETQTKTRSGIPGLDQLPGYIGDAFSNQNKTIARTELIIFIRPQIIRDSVDAHLVAEELRSKFKARVGAVTPKGKSSFELPIIER